MENATPEKSFLARHEFLIRRLHSLSGLIPVGAYMCIHLLTNASLLNGPGTFQNAVYQIHSFGKLLPVIEWVFIFIPILFHAIFGFVIIRGGLPNLGSYPLPKNRRYVLQRASGMIAFVFIMWHVFHLHGWFHFEAWTENVADPLGGHKFRPYNAASTLAQALSGTVMTLFYALGVIASVFHLANGIWTMGITWGVWTSPAAQARANVVCILFGVGLGVVGLSALGGAKTVDVDEAIRIEDQKYEKMIEYGDLDPEVAKHKRTDHGEGSEEDESGNDEESPETAQAVPETSPVR